MLVGVNNPASVRISVHCTSNQLSLTFSICLANITLPTFFFEKGKKKQNFKNLSSPTAATLKQNLPYSKSQLLFTSVNLASLGVIREQSGSCIAKTNSRHFTVWPFTRWKTHQKALRLRRGATAIALSPRAPCLILTSEPTVEALRELSRDLKWKGARHRRNGVQPGKKACMRRSGRSGS